MKKVIITVVAILALVGSIVFFGNKSGGTDVKTGTDSTVVTDSLKADTTKSDSTVTDTTKAVVADSAKGTDSVVTVDSTVSK